jgi:hypothetical protein
MIQYGFQRLALLNSAGYRRAELPLDAAVSLIAPNNTGKTSLINALQFLLIIDKRRMDFGAHDVEISRRFYFPHNSAYILLEVALPTTGTVVLGCVGKGVSHDYEYFAYKGALDVEEFRLDDGSQVQQPQFKEHMAKHGKLVFSYSASEFADALYGSRKKRQEHEPDFTVFKLEHGSQADVFQRVLTRTLRLDKLRSGEVKDYLLAIFRRDLPDSNIDFKAEWDKAFAEVNADRAQYDATFKQKNVIQTLERLQADRLQLRGKLLHFRPLIDAKLVEWENYYQRETAARVEQIDQLEQEESKLQLQDRELTEERFRTQQQLEKWIDIDRKHKELAVEFALIRNRGDLVDSLQNAEQRLNEQIALVQQATARGSEAIRRDLNVAMKEQAELQRELATIADNLYLHIKQVLPDIHVDALNRLFDSQVMTLGPQAFESSPQSLQAWLQDILIHPTGVIALPGLKISLESLAAHYDQRTPEQIQQRLAELEQLIDGLNRQLDAAQALDAANQEKQRLEAIVRQIQNELERFDELQTLNANQAERLADKTAIEEKLALLKTRLDGSADEAKRLRELQRALQDQLTGLRKQHQSICKRRENRGDEASLFHYLADLPHQVWLGGSDIALPQLDATLETYQHDCKNLLQLDEKIESRLAELHAGGLTKFQFIQGSETEIERIIEFAAHLPLEAEAIDRKTRDAVVNVTACLRELRDGLVTFKSKMNELNRLISRRQLSDLSVFKIAPVDETQLVEAVELLINTAEKANNGETFDLFNHGSVLDDEKINRAKKLLINEGEARSCLRVEHFFRLEFIVGKAGRREESFTDLDSAASNGTVLMAKLVTGLALLHLMLDKRSKVQAVCYLDEASALDQRNQRNLIDTAQDFSFALIFASPTPLVTARYLVPISNIKGHNQISRQMWQIIEPLEAEEIEA